MTGWNKRFLGAALLGAGLLGTLIICSPDPVPAERPADLPHNVFLIVVDTLRADHLGCYGYSRPTSPFVDELAAKSVLFEWCLTQWPKTGPSMAALFSSAYGSQSGVARNTGRWPVPKKYDMVAEIFHDAGYQTMASVSNASLQIRLNYDQGFEEYREDFTSASDAAELISKSVKDWMDDRDRNQPYFVWAHYIDPHTPYHAPEPYKEMFRKDEMFRADARPPVPIESIENTLPETKPKKTASVGTIPRHGYLEGKEHLREYVAEYDAEIRYFDDELRKLMTWMAQEGHLQDTIVIFTADHGESLGDHNYFIEHGRYPYDACTQIPLFLQHPDWQPGRVSEPVAQIDVFPTLLESLGFDQPWQNMGKSLLERIQKRSFPEDEPVFTESGYLEEYCISLRQGPWKLINIPHPKLRRELKCGDYQLFNVESDPGETIDLLERETDVVARMQPLLDQFREESYKRNKDPDNKKEERGELDPAAEAQLRALGYLDDDDDDPTEGGTEGGEVEPAAGGE